MRLSLRALWQRTTSRMLSKILLVAGVLLAGAIRAQTTPTGNVFNPDISVIGK